MKKSDDIGNSTMDLIIELLCAKLPRELVNKIIYEFGGAQTPAAKNIKPHINMLRDHYPGPPNECIPFGSCNRAYMECTYGLMMEFGYRRRPSMEKICKLFTDLTISDGITFPSSMPHHLLDVIRAHVSCKEYRELDSYFVGKLIELMQRDGREYVALAKIQQQLVDYVNEDLDYHRLCILRDKFNLIESPYRAKELLDKICGYQSDHQTIRSRIRTVWVTEMT